MKTILAAACLAAALPLGALAASISTPFDGNFASDGAMFDVDTGSTNLTIDSVDLRLLTGTLDVEFYYKTGSYVGFKTDPTAWTLHDSATLIGGGVGATTAWNIADLGLASSSTYSFYFTVNDLASPSSKLIYTNNAGSTEGSVLATNADLTVYSGLGVVYPFGNSLSGRAFNGTFNYTLEQSSGGGGGNGGGTTVVPLPASMPLLMAGFAGLLGLRRRKRA